MIYSDSLLKEQSKEGAFSRDTSKERGLSAAGSLAQLFGKPQSQGSDPMMERLFQNLKSLTEDGFQHVYGRSDTHTASVSGIESNRSFAQKFVNQKEQSVGKQSASGLMQRFAMGGHQEIAPDSQQSRSKSFMNQLGGDRSVQGSQKTLALHNETNLHGQQGVAGHPKVSNLKLQQNKTREKSTLKTKHQSQEAEFQSLVSKQGYESSNTEKEGNTSSLRPKLVDILNKISPNGPRKSFSRHSPHKKPSTSKNREVSQKDVSPSRSGTDRSNSRSRSQTVSQRSNKSSMLARSGKHSKPPRVESKDSGPKKTEQAENRPSPAPRRPRGAVNRNEGSRSPARRSIDSSEAEPFAAVPSQESLAFKPLNANGSIHSAASRVLNPQQSVIDLKPKGGHSRSVALIGDQPSKEQKLLKQRGPRMDMIPGDSSSQRSWGLQSSNRVVTGRTTFRGFEAGSTYYDQQHPSLGEDQDASMEDFTQLEKLAEEQAAEDQSSQAQPRFGWPSSDAPGEEDEECKRLTILGQAPQDSSLDESAPQSQNGQYNFEDEFEQYIPKNQDMFYIDDKASNNDGESVHLKSVKTSKQGQSQATLSQPRQLSQPSLNGPASSQNSSNVVSGSHQQGGMTRNHMHHQNASRGDERIVSPSNMFSLGTPAAGHSLPSGSNSSPPVSTSQNRQSNNHTGQGTDHQTSATEQAQSYVQCFHSTNMNMGGTIPELSQEREDDPTDEQCYDSGGMFLSSHDKRVLLEKLKQNFEQNSCFDVEFLMTGKGDKQKNKRAGMQQYSSSSNKMPQSESHPSTQSKPNIFMANWGELPEEGDSLDIDDRRVLFESEVRKQIHRNAPFEETEDYTRLELLHKLSKEHKALTKIDSVDTERSKFTDAQSLDPAERDRFRGSSFDNAQLNTAENLFNPQSTLQLKQELAGMAIEKPKTATQPRVTGVSVSLVEPLDLKNPTSARGDQGVDMHSFRQKLDSSRPHNQKSVDEVKLSVTSPHHKSKPTASQEHPTEMSVSDRSNHSRQPVASKSKRSLAAERESNRVNLSARSEKEQSMKSSRSKGSRVSRRNKASKEEEDLEEKITVRTLRSGGDKQIEELRNMFFDSNPEELQENVKITNHHQAKKQTKQKAHKVGGILESFGEDGEPEHESYERSVSLHHPEIDESDTTSMRDSKSKRSADVASKSVRRGPTAPFDEEFGEEITDQISQSGYSIISANNIDMEFERRKQGRLGQKQLPRNSTAAHIFPGGPKNHLGSMGAETGLHVQSVSTHKKPKVLQHQPLLLKQTNDPFNQRRSMQVTRNSIHVSLDAEGEQDEDEKEQSKMDDHSKEISLIHLEDNQAHPVYSEQPSPDRRRGQRSSHTQSASRKTHERDNLSKSRGFAGLMNQVNSSNNSFESHESSGSAKELGRLGDDSNQGMQTKILPKPIINAHPSQESELSEEDRQLKELTDYYMGVGEEEPSLIKHSHKPEVSRTKHQMLGPQSKNLNMGKRQHPTIADASGRAEKTLSIQLGDGLDNTSSPSRVHGLLRPDGRVSDTTEKHSRADSSIPTLSGVKDTTKSNTAKKAKNYMLRTSMEDFDLEKEGNTRFYGPGMTSSSGFFSIKGENPFPSGTMEEEYLLENLTEILGNEATPGMTHEKVSGRGENSIVSKPRRAPADRWKIHQPPGNGRSRSGSKEDRIEVMQKIIYQLEEENRLLKSRAFPQLLEQSPGRKPLLSIRHPQNRQNPHQGREMARNNQDWAGLTLSQDSKENHCSNFHLNEEVLCLSKSHQEYLKVDNGSIGSSQQSKEKRSLLKPGHHVNTLGTPSRRSQEKASVFMSELQTQNQPVVVQTFKSLVDYFPQAGYTHLHLERRSQRKRSPRAPFGR